MGHMLGTKPRNNIGFKPVWPSSSPPLKPLKTCYGRRIKIPPPTGREALEGHEAVVGEAVVEEAVVEEAVAEEAVAEEAVAEEAVVEEAAVATGIKTPPRGGVVITATAASSSTASSATASSATASSTTASSTPASSTTASCPFKAPLPPWGGELFCPPTVFGR